MIWSLYLLILLGFTACSLFSEQALHPYQLADMQAHQVLTNWYFNGRLAVVDQKSSATISISWRHARQQDQIELSGPLAQGKVIVTVSADQVMVDDGDNQKVFYGNADDVFLEQFGVEIPFSALQYWVLGGNDPQQAFVEQVDGFFQNDWRVSFGELLQVRSLWLPKKITATKNASKVKLIIDEWEL